MSDWLLLMQQVGADDLSTSQGPLGRIYRRHSDLAAERDRYKTALELLRFQAGENNALNAKWVERIAEEALASPPADPTRKEDDG